MKQFREYLLSKGAIPEKRVPYYEAWVSQFFAVCNKEPDHPVSSDEIEKFLLELSHKKNT